MRYYRITVDVEVNEEVEEEQNINKRRIRAIDSSWDYLKEKCNDYNDNSKRNAQLFLSSGYRESVIFGLMIDTSFNVEKQLTKFVLEAISCVKDISIKEITFNTLSKMLNEAERHGYIMDEVEVLRYFEIEKLFSRYNDCLFTEDLVGKMCKRDIYKTAEHMYGLQDSLILELDRIYAGKKQRKFMGHPVDYVIQVDDDFSRNKASKLIINSQYLMGRLENKRFTNLSLGNGNYYSRNTLQAIFRSNRGGAVTIVLNKDNSDDEDATYGDFDVLYNICEMSTEYRNDVLTIFCLPRECKNVKKKIYENMCGCTFVEIIEELSDSDKAHAFLSFMAEKKKVCPDENLYSKLVEGQLYHISELNKIYANWYGDMLKNEIFDQYKDFERIDSAVAKEKPRGSAYDELNEMIGLESAKEIINQALDNYKALKIFKDRGIVADESSKHMLFTGNPGTAKTTVARLFARIMKENNLLDSGHIVELGRGDIVGKYVGWTAPTVVKKFKEAMGGILFIDEAYSLVDDRNGSFGDEAINTIVQEMENHRNDLVVIFAGYPDKMEMFMKKNPGLRSRIAHHVHFDDYSPEELCDIAKLIAKNKGVCLDDGALEKLYSIMTDVVSEKDFGNGRYVRNIIERAKISHNSRLIKMNLDLITKETVTTLTAEDITVPNEAIKKTRPIGFAI